jgi:predicted phage replisome organizer
MADVKWIKIVTDIFDDEKMYAIECMPDGKDIELIWFKILCLAGKCNQKGFLIINDKLAYTDEMLAKIFRMDIGVVQRALDVFQSLEMIEVVENAYMISNWLMSQSGDKLEELKEKNRIRQQRFRDNQKAKGIEDKQNDSPKSNVTDNVTNNVTNNVTPSYSYSNNSNISNLFYLLNNKENEHIDYIEYINNHIELKDSVSDWFRYKDDKKPKSSNHYDTELGIKKLLNKIYKESLDYGISEVMRVIEESMGNNYQGIIWDKLGSKKAGSNTQPQSLFDKWMNA